MCDLHETELGFGDRIMSANAGTERVDLLTHDNFNGIGLAKKIFF